jgi:CubicO group peptidase (beta-lactamase class C family)
MLVLTRTRGIIAAAVMVAALTLGRDGKLAVNSSPLGGPNYGDAVFGGYSISTTAADYATFAQMLLNKGQLIGVRRLSPKTGELMATNHLPPPALASGAQSFLGPGGEFAIRAEFATLLYQSIVAS